VIQAWRLFKSIHLDTDLLGEGARIHGGRFNSKGVAVVYASASLSLAALEMLVHLQSVTLLSEYHMRRLVFDERLVADLDVSRLPTSWRESPPSIEVQQIGDYWVASGTSAILRAPSALLPQETNFILNPAHPEFRKVVFDPPDPFVFPPRVIEALRS
jgi:RES domain-containing protein